MIQLWQLYVSYVAFVMFHVLHKMLTTLVINGLCEFIYEDLLK
jgi:hypothetical protein